MVRIINKYIVNYIYLYLQIQLSSSYPSTTSIQ